MIPPEGIVSDGKLHRFSSNGKRGDDSGWYVLHDDGAPAGAFGDWRSDLRQTWRSGRPVRHLTVAETTARQAASAAIRQYAADEAAKQAVKIWDRARPAPANYPYLVRKRLLRAHGARIVTSIGFLVLALRDSDGTIHSLQYITPSGIKRFAPDGRVRGCYFSIGVPNGTIYVCEGFATGGTIRQATGHAVAVAFSAGNLKPVALALRMKFPKGKIILCADNDRFTVGNPGVTKATEAALAVHGY